MVVGEKFLSETLMVHFFYSKIIFLLVKSAKNSEVQREAVETEAFTAMVSQGWTATLSTTQNAPQIAVVPSTQMVSV